MCSVCNSICKFSCNTTLLQLKIFLSSTGTTTSSVLHSSCKGKLMLVSATTGCVNIPKTPSSTSGAIGFNLLRITCTSVSVLPLLLRLSTLCTQSIFFHTLTIITINIYILCFAYVFYTKYFFVENVSTGEHLRLKSSSQR